MKQSSQAIRPTKKYLKDRLFDQDSLESHEQGGLNSPPIWERGCQQGQQIICPAEDSCPLEMDFSQTNLKHYRKLRPTFNKNVKQIYRTPVLAREHRATHSKHTDAKSETLHLTCGQVNDICL